MKNLLYIRQNYNKAFLVSVFCLGFIAASSQIVPSAQLVNCPGQGLGGKNFPITIDIGGQPVAVYATTNVNVYHLAPPASECGIVIRPGNLLLPKGINQASGSISYIFSAPVSNVQLALQTQDVPGINQLAIHVTNGSNPVTPALTVFNSSPDSCSDRYIVSGNVVQTNKPSNRPATMINVGGAYFTTLTVQNISANNSRSWIDLRLCNITADCLPPEKPTLGSVVPAQAGTKGTFNILNYKASYSYIITPSSGVVQNRWKVAAPGNQSYSVTAVAGSCKSAESLPITIPVQSSRSVSRQ